MVARPGPTASSTSHPEIEHQMQDNSINNEEVLRRADVEDIVLKLVRSRLRCLGHVCQMEDCRPAKRTVFNELAHGSCPVGHTQAPLQRHLQKHFEVWRCP